MTSLIRSCLLLVVVLLSCHTPEPQVQYSVDAPPIIPLVFEKPPLGEVKPMGWLLDQLEAQAFGLTGHLDEFWPDIMNSAWKNSEGGDAWERTPYYVDGLVPLAYLLDNERLKTKSNLWIQAMIESAQDDGWFGPDQNEDRWPLAIAMKALSQYYEATEDPQAIEIIKGYFDWLGNHPPDWPDNEWRGIRAMEHAVSGYWLYRQEPDPELLKTIQLIQENSFNWSEYFQTFPWDTDVLVNESIPQQRNASGKTAHAVNVAMALKYPGLWYQQSKDTLYKYLVYKTLQNLDKHHGQVGGRFSGDEHLAGRQPTQGTELCGVVESMFSLEKLLEILGDPVLADRLELLAYNSLPGTMTADCWAHQYDQQANQVLVSNGERNWSSNGNTSNIYGLMPNYPCCLANFHQGWPKFIQHMWMKTQNDGVALILYGPNEIETTLSSGQKIRIVQETTYPFEGKVTLSFDTETPTSFPLYLRIPGWADGTKISTGGQEYVPEAGTFVLLEQMWQPNQTIEVDFPMKIRSERRFNQAISLLRGPLYFSLQIDKEYKKTNLHDDHIMSIDYLGSIDWEIYPTSPWNVALQLEPTSLDNITISSHPIGKLPFADQGEPVYQPGKNAYSIWDQPAPIVLELKGKILPEWKLINGSAGPIPISPIKKNQVSRELSVKLVPYGSARLRITEFPWLPS